MISGVASNTAVIIPSMMNGIILTKESMILGSISTISKMIVLIVLIISGIEFNISDLKVVIFHRLSESNQVQHQALFNNFFTKERITQQAAEVIQ